MSTSTCRRVGPHPSHFGGTGASGGSWQSRHPRRGRRCRAHRVSFLLSVPPACGGLGGILSSPLLCDRDSRRDTGSFSLVVGGSPRSFSVRFASRVRPECDQSASCFASGSLSSPRVSRRDSRRDPRRRCCLSRSDSRRRSTRSVVGWRSRHRVTVHPPSTAVHSPSSTRVSARRRAPRTPNRGSWVVGMNPSDSSRAQ